MPQPLKEWKVLPHGKLSQVAEDILSVIGELEMPLMKFSRRMTVVRLRDGRLIIYSAIALQEDEMCALEAFGRPTFLIVPSDLHRLDAKIWKDRYPGLQVIAPEGARTKIEEVIHVDATNVDFDDPNVTFTTVPGTRGHEAALLVRGTAGTTLILNDLIGNIRDRSGFSGWMLRLAGFAGDAPQIPKVVKMKIVDNAAALRDQLLEWSNLASLNRIIVSHGSTIEREPQDTLRALATSLAA